MFGVFDRIHQKYCNNKYYMFVLERVMHVVFCIIHIVFAIHEFAVELKNKIKIKNKN